MLIKRVNNKQFDVFFDSGWDNWARFELNNKHLSQVAGVKTPPQIVAYLSKRYGK